MTNPTPTPFFFTDQQFVTEIHQWSFLLEQVTEAGKDLPVKEERDIWDEDEAEKLRKYCSAVLEMNKCFLQTTTWLINKVAADTNLVAEYSSFKQPFVDVIQAQMLNYVYPGKTIEELIPVVELHKKTVDMVFRIVQKNAEN